MNIMTTFQRHFRGTVFGRSLVLGIFVLTVLYNMIACALVEDGQEYQFVEQFMIALQERDLQAVSRVISYPLSRGDYLPPIESISDLEKNFDNLFDSHLLGQLLRSSIEDDWHLRYNSRIYQDDLVYRPAGAPDWGMISFQSQYIDISDGSNETIFRITHIQQSMTEIEIEREIESKIRAKLHPLVREFISTVHSWETENFMVRVDKVKEGSIYDGVCRFASWKKPKTFSDRPDIVLMGGEYEQQGTGGNNVIRFDDGEYIAVCIENIIGNNETNFPGDLFILRDGKTICDEKVDRLAHLSELAE